MQPYSYLSTLLIVFMLFSGVHLSAYAQQDTLSITVYAENQSIEKRQEAFQTALTIAIRRLANIESQENPAFDDMRTTAAKFISGFRYTTRGEADVEALPIEDVPKLLLKVDFNSASLISEINRVMQFNVTANQQQQVMFWIVETLLGRRQVIAANQESQTATTLQQYAKVRRIVPVLPEFNAAERQLIQFTDIVGGFDSNILLAAQNYNVDQNVTLNLEQLPNREWRGVWTLLGDTQQRTRWLSTGASRAEVLNAGLQQLQTRLNQLAREADVFLSGDIRLEVQNVTSLADFAAIENFIRQLSSTSSVLIREIAADKVQFTVSVQGDPRVFERQMARNAALQIVLSQGDAPSIADLTFFYTPLVPEIPDQQDTSALSEPTRILE